MPRARLAFLAITLVFAVVPATHAQLGGLKKKVVDKATGRDTVAVAGKGTAKPKCDASSMVITSDVVDRYLKGLAAQEALMQKLAKEPGPTGAYYAAVLKRQAVQRRRDEYDLHRGPDWQKQQALTKRLMAGDTAAIRASATLGESLEPSHVEVPQLSWDDQQQGNARMDSTMKAAGQFTDCDWLSLGERLPRLAWTLIDDPDSKAFKDWGTASEAAAVRPRVVELARAMQIKYVSPADKARLAKEEADAKAAAAAPPTTGDPFLDCVAKAQAEWAKRHKAEMDKAQESQDVAALMSISIQMNQEAAAKCNKE